MSRTLQDWLAYIEAQHPKSIELGLERTREVAGRLSLEKPAAKVVTVGGTNGKGSTVAFIESIARAAGLKVGSYTSPHLLRYNERVRIDGREASDEALVAAFEAVEAARSNPSAGGNRSDLNPLRIGPRVERGGGAASDITGTDASSSDASRHLLPMGEGNVAITYFEFGTLAALWLFQQSGLDLAVLEVGLGGRLDAVNVVDADVSVITTVDIDHVDWLGRDRESIGFEKAGIARPWKPLVLGEVDPPSSVLRHAYAIGANAVRMGSDFFHEPIDASRWRWREVGTQLDLPNPVLAAPVQRANAATAIAALKALDLPITPQAFAEGVAKATLPGRLQVFERQDIRIVVDVAHNPQAARELAAWLTQQPSKGSTLAVFGALSDKDVAGIVAPLAPHVTRWLLAGLADAGPRSQSSGALAARLAAVPLTVASSHADVAQALSAALSQAGPADTVLVFGSFHTVADAMAYLHSGA